MMYDPRIARHVCAEVRAVLGCCEPAVLGFLICVSTEMKAETVKARSNKFHAKLHSTSYFQNKSLKEKLPIRLQRWMDALDDIQIKTEKCSPS